MKKAIVLMALVSILAAGAWGDNIQPTYQNTANPRLLRDMLRDWFEGFDYSWFLFSPVSSAPTGSEGKLYYDSDDDCLKLYNATSAYVYVNGKTNVEVFDANDTLTPAESGKTCVVDGYSTAANCVITLPTAEVGLIYTVVDANATANADTYIKAGTGDTINGGTAGQYLACKTDSAGQTVTLTAADSTRWLITASLGTWVADDAPD